MSPLSFARLLTTDQPLPMLNQTCLSAFAIAYCCSIAAAGDFSGKVVDEQGRPLRYVEVTLWTQSGQPLSQTKTDDLGRYQIRMPDIPVTTAGPLELMYDVAGRHLKYLGQLSGESSHYTTVVLMPADGPKTYERVYDALADYERTYYVIRGASTPETVLGHQGLRQKYLPRILEIPNPDGDRGRDMEFRARLRPAQMELLRRKRTQVLDLFGG